MEQKDRVFLSGICLTALLVVIPALLMRQALGGFDAFLSAGIACGFAFSWFFWRGRRLRLVHALSPIGILAAAAWIVYSVAVSSLGYKEVVLICLKGVFLLAVVYSFFIPSFSGLAPVQYLSLPAFLGQALFSSAQAGQYFPLLAFYLLSWIAVFRLRLYSLTDPGAKQSFIGPATLILVSVFFICGLAAADYFVRSISGPKLKYGGLLLEEDKRDALGSAEEDYSRKLERFQEEALERLPDLEKIDDKQRAMRYLATLVKESEHTLSTAQAEEGLISVFHNPGGGTKKESDRKHITQHLKECVDSKVILQQMKSKNDFLDSVKKNLFDFKRRLSAVNALNRLSSQGSRNKINDRERLLGEEIDKTGFDERQKEQLKQSARQLAEWKMFERYRQGLKDLEEKKNSDPVQSLLERIKAAGGLPEMKDTETQLRGFQHEVREREQSLSGLDELKKLETEISRLAKEDKEKAGQLQELLRLKLEMLIRQLGDELESEIDRDEEISSYRKDSLAKGAAKLRDARGAGQLAQASEFLNDSLDDKSAPGRRARELTQAKVFQQELETVERMDEALERAAERHGQAREFLKKLDQARARRGEQERQEEFAGLAEEASRFRKDGLIDAREHAVLEEGLRELGELLNMEQKLGAGGQRREETEKSGRLDLERLLEEAGFEPVVRETLEGFLKDVRQAQTLAGLEEISAAWQAQSPELRQSTRKKKEFDLFQREFEEMLQAKRSLQLEMQMSALREKIEQLDRVDPERAQELESALERMVSSQGQEMKEEIDKLLREAEQRQETPGERQGRPFENERLKQAELELEMLQEQLKEANARIAELEKQLVQADQQRERVLEQLKAAVERKRSLETQMKELNERKEKLRDAGETEKARQELHSAEQDRLLLEKELSRLEELKQGLERQVREEHSDKENLERQIREVAERQRQIQQELQLPSVPVEEAEAIDKKGIPGAKMAIMPYRLVSPAGSVVQLTAVAIIDDFYVKDITQEAEWTSDNPSVARVDPDGQITCLSPGVAQVEARFKGVLSRSITVSVGEPENSFMKSIRGMMK